MADLSPDAQAVMERTAAQVLADRRVNLEHITAAALRAGVDQVVPPTPFDRRYITEEKWDARDDIRNQLLAIAAELEALHG